MGIIHIVQSNIADAESDAIVNASNERLLAGSGVSEAIFQKAGFVDLLLECLRIGHCDTGDAVVTPGFKLKSRYIIHTVGPLWQGGYHGESKLLRSSYWSCLETAEQLGCHSITFPLISAGHYHYPVEAAWNDALKTCFDYMSRFQNSLIQEISFSVLDERIRSIGIETLRSCSNGSKKAEALEMAENRQGTENDEKQYDTQSITVTHKTEGKGVVIEQNEHYLTVQFANTTKKYQYPQAIQNGFLSFDDPDIQETALHSEPLPPRSSSLKPFDSLSFEKVKELFSEALQNEITYLKSHPSKPAALNEIRFIEKHQTDYIYSMTSEDDLFWPVGSAVHLRYGATEANAVLLAIDGNVLYLRTTALPQNVYSVEARVDSWFLLEKLLQRFVEACDSPSECEKALFTKGKTLSSMITGQENAVKMSFQQKASFVWGPPGTGKTETLAKIALKHMAEGHRVLMLSYSNVSVDGAVLRIQKLGTTLREGAALRYGYPREKEVAENPLLSFDLFAAKKNPKLFGEIQATKDAVNKARQEKKNDKTLLEYIQKLDSLYNALGEEKSKLLREASFIATTVSKAVADHEIYDQTFDVVLFDEVSMAYVPQIVFGAKLAKKHIVCFGDFNQLPPIVQGTDSSDLNRDIFELAGISSYASPRENLCMLNIQYRMHSQIAAFAGKHMYRDLLRTGEEVDGKVAGVSSAPPFANDPMMLLDTSGLMTVCGQNPGKSHYNILSAFLSFSLGVLSLSGNHSTGIITPYRDQANLLSCMAKDYQSERNDAGTRIQSSTVHQFQGSERDTIIFDTVDCYRQAYPGILLTNKNHSLADRLLNVAITRARGKMITVCNADFMKEKGIRSPLLLGTLIDNPPCVAKYAAFLNELRHINYPQFRFFSDISNTEEPFIQDLKTAKKKIRIDIPSGLLREVPAAESILQSMKMQMKAKVEAGVKVIIRFEKREGSNIPFRWRETGTEDARAVNPLVIIDDQIIWYGLPASNAEFHLKDGTVLPTVGKPIFRFDGRETARKIIEYLCMDNSGPVLPKPIRRPKGFPYQNFSEYIEKQVRCPKCGKPMKMKKSAKGGHYLMCSGWCTDIQKIQKQQIEEYLYSIPGNGYMSGLECSHDHTSLTPKWNSKKGDWEIRCNAVAEHTFSLDQI